MKPSLALVRARVNAAKLDLKFLKSEMVAYFKGYGDPIRLATKPDPKNPTSAFFVFVHNIAPVEHRWSRQIAHFLYDCRSALDQTVWQLYIAAKRKEPSPRLARQLAFPITTRKKAWAEELRRHRLDGIHPTHVASIERVQPHHVRRYATHSLTLIARLNDMDKHREPAVVLFSASAFKIGVEHPEHCRVVGIDQMHDLGRPLKVGTNLARIRFVPTGTGNPRVNVYGQGSIQPAFENGLLVEDTLDHLMLQTEFVVTFFERTLTNPKLPAKVLRP